MVRQLFCHGEGNDIPVQLRVPFCQRPEKGRNGFMQLLDSALGRGRRVAVIARIAHTCRGTEQLVTPDPLNSAPWNRWESSQN